MICRKRRPPFHRWQSFAINQSRLVGLQTKCQCVNELRIASLDSYPPQYPLSILLNPSNFQSSWSCFLFNFFFFSFWAYHLTPTIFCHFGWSDIWDYDPCQSLLSSVSNIFNSTTCSFLSPTQIRQKLEFQALIIINRWNSLIFYGEFILATHSRLVCLFFLQLGIAFHQRCSWCSTWKLINATNGSIMQ